MLPFYALGITLPSSSTPNQQVVSDGINYSLEGVAMLHLKCYQQVLPTVWCARIPNTLWRYFDDASGPVGCMVSCFTYEMGRHPLATFLIPTERFSYLKAHGWIKWKIEIISATLKQHVCQSKDSPHHIHSCKALVLQLSMLIWTRYWRTSLYY